MDSSEKKEKRKIRFKFKYIKRIIYFVAIIMILLLFVSKFERKRISFDSASNLIKIDEVSKFNLAKFKWDGIAKYYKDNNKFSVNTFIKYQAEIVATMNVDNFVEENIEIDEKSKIIFIKLPTIELIPTIIFKEEGDSFSFIPKSTNIEMKDIITTCENDAKEKVKERIKIMEIAKNNAKNTIEGLLLPLIEEEHYTIVWKDGE